MLRALRAGRHGHCTQVLGAAVGNAIGKLRGRVAGVVQRINQLEGNVDRLMGTVEVHGEAIQDLNRRVSVLERGGEGPGSLLVVGCTPTNLKSS